MVICWCTPTSGPFVYMLRQMIARPYHLQSTGIPGYPHTPAQTPLLHNSQRVHQLLTTDGDWAGVGWGGLGWCSPQFSWEGLPGISSFPLGCAELSHLLEGSTDSERGGEGREAQIYR